MSYLNKHAEMDTDSYPCINFYKRRLAFITYITDLLECNIYCSVRIALAFNAPDLSLVSSLWGVKARFLFLRILDKSSPNTSPVLKADINSSNSP